MPNVSESRGQHEAEPSAGVSPETVEPRFLPQDGRRDGEDPAFSTDVRSVIRNTLRACCVSSVPSAVALRTPSKRCVELSARALRTSEWRKSEWRKSVLRNAFEYPPASPKDTLAGVFERLKRAARRTKSLRISERLAPRPAYPELRPAYPESRTASPSIASPSLRLCQRERERSSLLGVRLDA